MLFYNNSIRDGNLTISIDNVILDVSVTDPGRLELLEQMLTTSAAHGGGLIQTWQGFRPGTFRHQTLIRIDEERSYWIGQGLIGNGTLEDRVRLDFNPNKVGNDPNFELVREFLVRNSRPTLCRIPRFDLAIDLPVDRARCFLVKDRRLYIERRHGVEYTQYLGAKSSMVGRVKLYNKAAEAKLDYPLTRLELTLDPAMAYEDIKLPAVYCLNSANMTNDGIKATDTERFIINALLHGCGSLNDLGRKTRAKMETILKNFVTQIDISPNAYAEILKRLGTYLEGSAK